MRIEIPKFAGDNLKQAIEIANEMLEGKRNFMQEVRRVNAFALSNNPSTHRPFSGDEIADLLAQKVVITVEKYKPWYVWSKAVARTTPGVPVIQLNARKLDREVPSLVNTLIHESLHVIDTKLNFAHGDNYADGKDDTAPYKIGAIAERLASKVT